MATLSTLLTTAASVNVTYTSGTSDVTPVTLKTTDITTDITANTTELQQSTELPVQETTGYTNQATFSSTPLVKFCPGPSLINAGKILSTGPYIANASTAVYSCVAGYVLTGPAKIRCNADGIWEDRPPQCVLANKQHDVHNHITMGDAMSVPLWLTIILCVVFGLLCLLLLACLLIYCLKLFGCWKGSAVGAKTASRRHADSVRDGATSVFLVDDFGSDNYYRSKRAYDRETDNGISPRRTQPATNHVTSRLYGDVIDRNYRREAKMPANKTWMPHSRNFRNINTSTK